MLIKQILLAAFLASAVRGDDEVTTPSCVEAGREVVVGFEVDDNNSGDWIGFYRVSDLVDGNKVPDPREGNWVWSCGNQSCGGNFPKNGPVMIEKPDLDGSLIWIAVLARFAGNLAPFDVVAQSAPFIVKSDCLAPNPTAGPDPTPSPITIPTHPPTPSPTILTTTPAPTVQTPPPTPSPTNQTPPPPTPSPTNQTPPPTPPPPTPPPTNQMPPPTTQTPVRMDKSLYEYGEPFSVTFEVDDPQQGDWVAVYDASTPLDSLNTAHFWLWVCDQQGGSECEGRSSGTIVFGDDKDISWASVWPLEPGEYKTVVMRNSDTSPWEPINASPNFTIKKPTSMGDAAVRFARHDIEQLVIGRDGNVALAAKFLRLGFHDCVGGCDGCVDLTFLDNRGLDVPIDALEPVWQKHKDIFSRADIWALSTLVGPHLSQPNSGFRKDFDFFEFGRIDCEHANDQCFNEHGDEHGCTTKRGPHRHIPGINTGTHELFEFFKDEFGFNTRETVAIMGAHTLGQLARENSGVGGEHGWLLNNKLLDNEYYIELVGGDGPDDSLENHIQGAPNWLKHFESNSDLADFPDKHVWIGLPEGTDGRIIIMLNTDIALVRDLNEDNMREDGRVNCNFVDRSNTRQSTCPHAAGALEEAVRYRFSNRIWLNDFEDTLVDMLRNGYSIDEDKCNNDFCELQLGEDD